MDYAILAAAEWVPDWASGLAEGLSDLWPIIIAVITILAVMKWAFSKILIPEIRAQLSDVTEIKNQVTNNGGSSMKDAVDRVEKKFDEIKILVEEISTERRTEFQAVTKAIKTLSNTIDLHSARITVSAESDDLAWYQIDEKANLIWVNNSYLNLFGISFQEALSNEWVNYISEADREHVNMSGQAAIATKTPWVEEFNIVNKQGIEYHVIARGYPTFDTADDTLTGFVGAMQYTIVTASAPVVL